MADQIEVPKDAPQKNPDSLSGSAKTKLNQLLVNIGNELNAKPSDSGFHFTAFDTLDKAIKTDSRETVLKSLSDLRKNVLANNLSASIRTQLEEVQTEVETRLETGLRKGGELVGQGVQKFNEQSALVKVPVGIGGVLLANGLLNKITGGLKNAGKATINTLKPAGQFIGKWFMRLLKVTGVLAVGKLGYDLFRGTQNKPKDGLSPAAEYDV